ncbi:MAG: GNAT family N-acetyltransferase [SAR202 cluster bacterium]|nr:GNAT family N-acetyltransferase [SAR202 cluster bacterium]
MSRVTALEITCRSMQESDLPLMLAWRLNPKVGAGLTPGKQAPTWDEHRSWWRRREGRVDWIIEAETDDFGKRPVGSVNARLGGLEPEIGVFVGETTLWGRGVARAAIDQLCAWLAAQGHVAVVATIAKSNERSRRLLQGCGFARVQATAPDTIRVRRELRAGQAAANVPRHRGVLSRLLPRE